MDAQQLIDQLRLEPHPEGGFFRRSYTASHVAGGRNFMSSIYYLLTADSQQVILPDLAAGCSMADMARLQQVEEAWERLQRAVYYRAGWCDAYGYALVATGRVEAMLDPFLNIWDCAPLLPILTEAGGYFGDWKGNAGDFHQRSKKHRL